MQLGFSYNFILAAEPFTKVLLLYLLVTAYVEIYSYFSAISLLQILIYLVVN